MAKIPTAKLIEKTRAQSEQEVLAKRQEYLDADRKPFRADGYGPGIMPQEVFDTHRHPSDPDYKPREV